MRGVRFIAKSQDYTDTMFQLRPSVIAKRHWRPDKKRRDSAWKRLSRAVLERDSHTCQGCGHRAQKFMHMHHVAEGGDDSLDNLITLCVACHAVMHIGRNLDFGTIEIWESDLDQAEIIRRTRQGVSEGKSLSEIKKSFKLKRGPHDPSSIDYANDLLLSDDSADRLYLEEPLCAVFVSFKQWQIENET